jgi:hypothetical protein
LIQDIFTSLFIIIITGFKKPLEKEEFKNYEDDKKFN